MRTVRYALITAVALVALVGCRTAASADADAPMVLQLLHFADVDGNQDDALDSVDEFSAIVNALVADPTYGPSTLLVSSGDNILPGPRFSLATDPLVTTVTGGDTPAHLDIFWMNELGVAASALGNHELDQGPATLAAALAEEGDFSGSRFPYLSANVNWGRSFDVGRNGRDVGDLAGQVASYATVTVADQRIGLVGAVTPTLGGITSAGDVTTTPRGINFTIPELAVEIQRAVDALVDDGVNKIIVLSHMQQISIEEELAGALTDVDIIVAGGSNTLLADDDDMLIEDDVADGAYPLTFTNPDGEPVLVVNVSGDYQYLGRLVVSFDAAGTIDVEALNPELNGPIAATEENAAALGGAPNPAIVASRDAVQTAIANTLSRVVGYSAVDIYGDRETSRVQQSNGGDLTADANLWYANLMADDPVQISIKNGGGIRADVDAGAITLGDVATILAFNNGLATVSVTAEELKGLLEHAISRAEAEFTPDGALGGQGGSFPQVAGMWVGIDVSRSPRVTNDAGQVTAAGQRIRELALVDETGDRIETVITGGEIQGDPNRTFRLVSLNFLINGGSGWPFPNLSTPQRRNLYAAYNGSDDSTITYETEDFSRDPGNFEYSLPGLEQDALAEYFATFHPTVNNGFDEPEQAPVQDRRIQLITPSNPWVAPSNP